MKCVNCGQAMIKMNEGEYFCPPCRMSVHDAVYRPPEVLHYTGVRPNTMDKIVNGVSVRETLAELENAYDVLGKAIKLMKEMME